MDEVVQTLIDRIPASEAASAPGWRAARLEERPYPGLVADGDAEAPGRVYRDLSEQEWEVLDAFEDPTYVVEPVALRAGRRALAYVWPEASALPTTWTLESLDDQARSAYIARVGAWRERHDNRG